MLEQMIRHELHRENSNWNSAESCVEGIYFLIVSELEGMTE